MEALLAKAEAVTRLAIGEEEVWRRLVMTTKEQKVIVGKTERKVGRHEKRKTREKNDGPGPEAQIRELQYISPVITNTCLYL